MNKNYFWLALILSLLVIVPFNWFLGTTSLFVVFINMITKFSIYFIGILSALYLIQHFKQKSDYEKQIIELLKEIKESKKKDNV